MNPPISPSTASRSERRRVASSARVAVTAIIAANASARGTCRLGNTATDAHSER